MITLTAQGGEQYERLVAARGAGLRELLAGWSPDEQAELQQLVDKLARDLVAEIPEPTGGLATTVPRPQT
jgi:DNA-binding MarR family transcriptional regulator